LSFESGGLALLALDKLSKLDSAVVVEIIHRFDCSDLLVLLDANDVETLCDAVDFPVLKSRHLIESPHSLLLKSYLNLENSDILDSAIFFEGESLGLNLEITNHLLNYGWKVTEFRFSKSGNSKGHVLLTGSGKLEKSFLDAWSVKGNLTFISSPSRVLTEYYNLNP
jgi:hypothetical protein